MKNNEPVKSTRLEQLLQMWEEVMLSGNLSHRIALKDRNSEALRFFGPESVGPFRHFRELRRHLLEIRSIDEFDYRRFDLYGRDENGVAWLNRLGINAILGGMLAAWTCCSRRFYHIDRDLQALLGATSLKRLRLRDIPMPFESFAISLEDPIIANNGEAFDVLLFAPIRTRVEGTDELVSLPTFFLFNSKLGEFRPILHDDLLNKRIARGQFATAYDQLQRNQQRIWRPDLASMMMIGNKPDTLVTDLLLPSQDHGDMKIQRGVRIAFGLALYLKSLPVETTHASSWNTHTDRPNLSPDRRAIDEESKVCYVSSIRELSDEDREAMNAIASGRGGGWQMRVHFREGYWHRRRGEGKDPTKVKTEWTRPTIVRRDRLAEGTQPGGSQVNLSRKKPK